MNKNNRLNTVCEFYNKTYEYLAPQINIIFNESQLKVYLSLNVITFAIYDDALNVDDEYNLHIVFTTNKASHDYNILSKTEYFIRHYKNTLGQHVMVYKLPIDNIKEFIKGEYSKLYTEQQIEDVIIKETEDELTSLKYYTTTYLVLTRSEEYKQFFLDKLKKDFNLNAIPDDQLFTEYDYPPLLSSEVLNHTPNKKSTLIKSNILQQ